MIRLFNKNILVILLAIYIVVGFSLNQPINAQITYPVSEQSSKYSLRTQISPAEIAKFEKIFQFGQVRAKKSNRAPEPTPTISKRKRPGCLLLVGKNLRLV